MSDHRERPCRNCGSLLHHENLCTVPATKASPLIVEKHRYRLDGSEEVSFYACGPVRESLEEAIEDARIFSEIVRTEASS